MIKRIMAIIKKEFLHLRRDPWSLTLMIALPIFLLIVFGYAASFEIKNIPLAVLDNNKTLASRDIVERFTQSGYFHLEESLVSEDQFKDQLDSGKAKVIINIPSDFSKNIALGRTAVVQVLIDGSDPTWASSAIGYVGQIIQNYHQAKIMAVFQKMGISANNGTPINLISRVWYNETLSSMNFFVPGLIAVILMSISATLTSFTIVSEKEQGTMESLIVSPVRKNELMLGKIMPYVIIAFVDVIVVTLLAIFMFHVPFKGSFLLLIFSSIIFLVGALSIGILISSNAKTSTEAEQLAFLATMLPAILLSGFVFPIANMPWILQVISLFIPARYYIEILRGIFLKGVGIESFWQAFSLMTILSLIILAASIRSFNKRIE